MPAIRLKKETMNILDRLVNETELTYDEIILASINLALDSYDKVYNDQD